LIKKSSGLYRAKDIQLADDDKGNIFQNFTCSGTDNGIVNMTESISFPVEKFQVHDSKAGA
jgi:hypothetical protein